MCPLKETPSQDVWGQLWQIKHSCSTPKESHVSHLEGPVYDRRLSDSIKEQHANSAAVIDIHHKTYSNHYKLLHCLNLIMLLGEKLRVLSSFLTPNPGWGCRDTVWLLQRQVMSCLKLWF